MTIRIALVGFGKIARDEHLPAILADGRYRLAAIATRSGDPGLDVPCFAGIGDMIAAMPGALDAVALCTPTDAHFDLARVAIEAGLAVLLEKPPTPTLGEIAMLEAMARARGVPFYAAWHSQHAAGVDKAARALAGEEIAALDIVWREDVRRFHPGQSWIWQAGGFGVFDAGINGLSIASRIMPCPLLVRRARLLVPANCQTPIAAGIEFAGENLRAWFDWRATGSQEWSITVSTRAGSTVELAAGGARLLIDGAEQQVGEHGEYAAIYRRFAAIAQQRLVEVDAEPLRISADAFLCGERETVEPFVE